jgi:hypothetical protein
VCTARTELRRRPVAIAWWLGKAQAKAVGQAGLQRLSRSAGAGHHG